MGNAAYIAPISLRPLPTNMSKHRFKPIDISRNTFSAAYAVVNASSITDAAHLIPEVPNCTGVVQRAWVVTWMDEDEIAAASRV
jgi:transcription antitermination factor NusG